MTNIGFKFTLKDQIGFFIFIQSSFRKFNLNNSQQTKRLKHL